MSTRRLLPAIVCFMWLLPTFLVACKGSPATQIAPNLTPSIAPPASNADEGPYITDPALVANTGRSQFLNAYASW